MRRCFVLRRNIKDCTDEDMKEILERITSYNLFNHLFPGIIFSVITTEFTPINLLFDDLIIGVFIYYFIGTIISRIGSIFIEPLLKKFKSISNESYGSYIKASKEDLMIQILLESLNMYRTFLTLFLCFLALKLYLLFESGFLWLSESRSCVFALFFVVIFLLSYIKQAGYITLRIKESQNE